MIKRINKWWMSLEPGEQYMYWIITFCMMLISSIAILLGTAGFITGKSLSVFLFMLVAGVSGFVGLFMIVVLFLTVIWPHKYQDVSRKIKPQ